MIKKENKSNGKLAVQKLLVGHFVEEIPDDFSKKVAYVWQGDGIWEVRKLPIGTFTNIIQKFEVPGLKRTMKEGWTLNVPRIPATLLDVTLSFFRQIYNKHSSEVFLQYFYDFNSEEYVLHCPQQAVGPGSVSYRRDAEYERGKTLVFEIHSHGSMAAFFSGTDDADEKDDRFFGVIGKVKQYYPEMKIRLSIGGKKQEVDVEDIFNLDEGSYHKESFPAEWVSRIKEKKVEVVKRERTRPSRSGAVYYPAERQLPLEMNPYELVPHELHEQDGCYEELHCTGIQDDQKLVEKDGKIYIVTSNGDKEEWEEIETNELDDKRNNNNGREKNDGQNTVYPVEEDEDSIYYSSYDWRNIKW
jgi:PRTRC genetic system protein A